MLESQYKQTNKIMYLISFYGAIIGQMLIFFGLPYGINLMISAGTMLIAITCALGFLYLVFFEKKNFRDGIFLILFAAWVLLFIVVISGLSYANIIKAITFIELPIFLFLSSRVKGAKIKQAIYAVAIIYAIWFIFLSFSQMAYMMHSNKGDRVLDVFVLGFTNPNETAMYLYCTFILLFSALFYFQNKILKILYLIATIWIGYIISETLCRGIIVVSVLVVVLCVLIRRLKVSRTIIGLILFCPIIFFIITLSFNEQLIKIVFYGDSFETGRFDLYSDYLDHLTAESLIFGNFSKYEFSNKHNAYLSVVASIGLIGFTLYFCLLLMKFFMYANIKFNKNCSILLLGLFGIIIYSSLEAAILVTGSAYAVITFMIKTALDA